MRGVSSKLVCSGACFRSAAPHLRGMNSTTTKALKADLSVTQVLAHLLERLEQSSQPLGAEQYRSVVTHLVQELQEAEPGPMLGRILDAYPAAAQVYENMNYQHAGLCRSGLDASLAAELEARKVVARAMQKPELDSSNGKS